MKTKRTKILSLLAIGLLVVGISVAWAAPEAGCWGQDCKMAKSLNLTAEQKSEIQKLRLANEEKRIDLDADIKKIALQIREENKKDVPDESKVMNLLDEIGKARTEVSKLRASQMIAVKKILTPEQREKAREMAGKQARKRSEALRKNRGGHGRQGAQGGLQPMVRQRMQRMRSGMGRPAFRGMAQKRGEKGITARHGRADNPKKRVKAAKPNRPAKEKYQKKSAPVESKGK